MKRAWNLLIAAMALGGMAACGSESPTASSASAPIVAPRPEVATGQTFVGSDVAGYSIALRIDGATAIGYRCNGTAAGQWFTGTYDDTTGIANLTGPAGATLRAVVGTTVTAEIASPEVTSVKLEAAGPGAGLFRDAYTADGTALVAGWIVHNDGEVIGTQTNATGEAVPFAARGRFGCGVLGFRIQWNLQQGNTQIAEGMVKQFNIDCGSALNAS